MNINHKQAGLTLIEVMVSLTLGIFFLVVAMQYLLSGQQAFQSQDSGTRIQENARFAMEILRENIRVAGYSEDFAVNPGYIFRGPCGTVNGLVTVNCSDDNVTTAASPQGDRLAIALTSPNQQDCLGNDTGSTATRIANVFWVQITGDISSLYCWGWDIDAQAPVQNATPQPLVDGVDQMQIQYGIANAATGVVDRYLNATAVEALDAGTGNAWGSVRSIRVALLINAGLDTNDADNDASTIDASLLASQYTNFTLLDESYTRATDDRQLRRVYNSLVTLNNAL